MREWRSGCRKVHRRAREGLGPFEAIIVPDSVYGGDGAIFVSENSISGARIVFLQLPRPEIRRLSAKAAGVVVAGELAPRPPAIQNTFGQAGRRRAVESSGAFFGEYRPGSSSEQRQATVSSHFVGCFPVRLDRV